LGGIARAQPKGGGAVTAATIPVDLLNPGQVFACLGIMEAAEVLVGPCIGEFIGGRGSTRAQFSVTVDDKINAVEEAIEFLVTSTVTACSPLGSELSAAKWEVDTHVREDRAFPFSIPDTPATLPALLTDPRGRSIAIEHWGDGGASGRDNVKFWAGAGGYPGVALARDAIELLEPLRSRVPSEVLRDPFAVPFPQSSSFRFDWRRDYVPMDVGFSPNNHGTSIKMVGYPLVEMFAAIGLQHARPHRIDKLNYRYAVAHAALPTTLVRAVLGGHSLNFPSRTFRMRLGWPGKEGQARCIIDTQEESTR
jgi:CRISPR-associated protein Csb3